MNREVNNMIKRVLITLALTSAMLFSVSNIAKANDCVKNTEAYLKSDKMAAISIIEKTGHITVYVDNYNPVQKKFGNIGAYGWNKDMANRLIESGCVSPVFIPLYAHDGSVKFVAEAVDQSKVEFIWENITNK